MTDPDVVARSLPATQWAVSELVPAQWREVAEFVLGILGREPIRSGAGWEPIRLVLGCLASELAMEAAAAGEPPAEAADLVAPATARAERELLAAADRSLAALAETVPAAIARAEKALAAPAEAAPWWAGD